MNSQKPESNPLDKLDQWEDFVESATYPEPESKKKENYRNYDDPARDCVREFYRLNHKHQSFDFVMKKREEFLGEKRERKEMTTIQALELLNTLVDDSDPDIDLPQIQHLLQTSESIRSRGCEDWFVLVGLIHDLGKLLCIYGEPQWAVVGDTFPVGCQYSDKIVYPEFFELNQDFNDARYNTRQGIYEEGCGLRNVYMSWGHDEYMYHLVKNYLPDPALYMIRYHSFYAWHREGAYEHLLDDHDRKMLPWVKRFNPFDLYTKCPEAPLWSELKPFYEELIAKYLPPTLKW